MSGVSSVFVSDFEMAFVLDAVLDAVLDVGWYRPLWEQRLVVWWDVLLVGSHHRRHCLSREEVHQTILPNQCRIVIESLVESSVRVLVESSAGLLVDSSVDS